jgi:hypothetical protein
MSQPTAMPTQKVTAAAIGGALAAIGAWLLSEIGGVQMPAGAEAGFATLIATLIAYLTPERD